MSFTLLDCCRRRVFQDIEEGLTRNIDYKLNFELSKIIYEWLECHEISPDVATEVGLKFQLKDVIVDQDPHEQYIGMIHAQKSIKSLVLQDLYKLTALHTDYIDEDTEMELVIVDIVAALKRLLSVESRKTLESLSIKEGNVLFSEGWIPQIPTLLPALTFLCLFDIFVDSDMFPLIWKHLVQLKNLFIKDHHVDNLTGISTMQNLEMFMLIDTRFKSKEDIMEIFELKKLRFLSLERRTGGWSNGTPSPTNLLAQCKKVLPALTFLDCSGNDISAATITKLAESHPHLKEICIMNTPMEETAEIPTENRERLQLLSTGSLGNCVRFLQYHQEKEDIVDSAEKLKTLRAILKILQEKYNDQLEVERTLCADAVSEAMDNSNLDLNMVAVKILTFLARDSGLQRLSEHSTKELIRNLLWCDQKEEYIVHSCATPEQYETMYAQCHRGIWSLLLKISTLKLSPNNAEHLVKGTLDAFDDWTTPRQWSIPFQQSLIAKVLKNGLNQLTKPFQSVKHFRTILDFITSVLGRERVYHIFFDFALMGCELIAKCVHGDEMLIKFIMVLGFNFCENCNQMERSKLLRYIEQISIKFGDRLSRLIREQTESPQFISSMFPNNGWAFDHRRAKMSFVFTVLYFSEATQLLPIGDVWKIRKTYVDRAQKAYLNFSPFDVVYRDMLTVRTFELIRWTRNALIQCKEPSYSIELEILKLHNRAQRQN